MTRGAGQARPQQRGAATAELAMVLPILVAVTWGMVWLMSVGLAQVRTVDAARETARAAARGDPTSVAVAAGRRVAPPGAAVTVAVADEQVVVDASAMVSGPGGLFEWLPQVRVHARAVAVSEESS